MGLSNCSKNLWEYVVSCSMRKFLGIVKNNHNSWFLSFWDIVRRWCPKGKLDYTDSMVILKNCSSNFPIDILLQNKNQSHQKWKDHTFPLFSLWRALLSLIKLLFWELRKKWQKHTITFKDEKSTPLLTLMALFYFLPHLTDKKLGFD